MLLDNFKPLLFFGGGGTFVDVTGATVNLSFAINGETIQSGSNVTNNHINIGVSRSFNYNTTTATNSCIDEQDAYWWDGVVNTTSSFSSARDMQSNGFVLFVGTGDTAVASQDYCLDTPIGLTPIAAYCLTPASGIVTTSRTFENSTANDVTIKEVGLYLFRTGSYLNYGGPYTPTFHVIMIGRKVLDTPVTIPVGEARTFEYTIDMNHITFQNADNGDLLRFQNI